MINTISVEFEPADVQQLLQHAEAATEHLPCMGDQFVAKYYAGGKVITKNDWPDVSQLELSRIPPALFLVNDSFLMSNGIATEQAIACVYKNGHIPSEQQNESDAFALGSEELPTVTRILTKDFAGIETAQKVRITFLHDQRKGPVVTLELVDPANETPDVRVVSRHQ
ncbi:hypothetical protein LT85_1607 [Collimonas arenae]|uniref:Uncharacterized protein n=1 Tax=Collimonas arenae TaxID=279058 RepID=A0A0A1FAK3_9BURK|nr:hypothetical protein [Collimonas arenae]AIY40765.1 hypothetical protein LT85_1607 [Collimonas arenae]